MILTRPITMEKLNKKAAFNRLQNFCGTYSCVCVCAPFFLPIHFFLCVHFFSPFFVQSPGWFYLLQAELYFRICLVLFGWIFHPQSYWIFTRFGCYNTSMLDITRSWVLRSFFMVINFDGCHRSFMCAPVSPLFHSCSFQQKYGVNNFFSLFFAYCYSLNQYLFHWLDIRIFFFIVLITSLHVYFCTKFIRTYGLTIKWLIGHNFESICS